MRYKIINKKQSIAEEIEEWLTLQELGKENGSLVQDEHAPAWVQSYMTYEPNAEYPFQLVTKKSPKGLNKSIKRVLQRISVNGIFQGLVARGYRLFCVIEGFMHKKPINLL